MSPEQCQSDPLDARSDIFAAGIVLWECLAGRRLYKSDSVVKSVERIMHEAPIPPTRVNADCDPELSKVVVKALQKNPKDRFATAEEFRDALDEAVHRAHHYRASEARSLMHALFQDVMDHQRHILDACLSAAESTGRDRSEVPLEINHEVDSDVHIPPLDMAGEVEPTSPSAHHRSPLITHEEGGIDDDLPKTKGARPKVHSGSLPNDSGVHPTDVTVATGPAPQTAARKSRAPLFAALLLLLFVPLCGVAIAIGVQQSATPSGETAIAASPDPVRPKAPVQNGAGRKGEAKKENVSQDEKKAATRETDRKPGERDRAERVKADDNRGTSRASRRRTRQARPKVAAKPKDPVTSRKEPVATITPPPTPKPEPKVEPGTLTLDTVPWTRVYLGKKFLGNTPLVGVPIPAGRNILRLVNKEEGVDHRYEANVTSGKRFRARLGLK